MFSIKRDLHSYEGSEFVLRTPRVRLWGPIDEWREWFQSCLRMAGSNSRGAVMVLPCASEKQIRFVVYFAKGAKTNRCLTIERPRLLDGRRLMEVVLIGSAAAVETFAKHMLMRLSLEPTEEVERLTVWSGLAWYFGPLTLEILPASERGEEGGGENFPRNLEYIELDSEVEEETIDVYEELVEKFSV
jgi:hypothetical protein